MTILSDKHLWKYTEFIENKNFSFDKNKILNSLSKEEIDDAYLTISKWDGYSPTPLEELTKLSKELNLNKIFYKDESKRFKLKSFYKNVVTHFHIYYFHIFTIIIIIKTIHDNEVE